MFTLFSGLWDKIFTKTEYKIAILGLDNAGKTTLFEQLKSIYSGSPQPNQLKIIPTIGQNFGKVDLGRQMGTECWRTNHSKLVIWDIGGQIDMRSLWEEYFSVAHAIIYVIDASSNNNRLDESKKELDKLAANKELDGAPILILLNKQDLPNARSPAQIELNADLLCGVNKRFVHSQPISAMSGEGVKDALIWLLNQLPHCPRTKDIGTGSH